MKIETYERETEASCPLCHAALFGVEAARCGGCDTHYHADCLVELGGCSTLGCAHFRKQLRRDARLGITLTPVIRPLSFETRVLASGGAGLGGTLYLLNPIGVLFGPEVSLLALAALAVVLSLLAFAFLTVWSRRRSQLPVVSPSELEDLAEAPRAEEPDLVGTSGRLKT